MLGGNSPAGLEEPKEDLRKSDMTQAKKGSK